MCEQERSSETDGLVTVSISQYELDFVFSESREKGSELVSYLKIIWWRLMKKELGRWVKWSRIEWSYTNDHDKKRCRWNLFSYAYFLNISHFFVLFFRSFSMSQSSQETSASKFKTRYGGTWCVFHVVCIQSFPLREPWHEKSDMIYRIVQTGLTDGICITTIFEVVSFFGQILIISKKRFRIVWLKSK